MLIISRKSGKREKVGSGSCVTEKKPISQESTTSSATTTQLTQNPDIQTSDIQTESGFTSGRPAKQTTDATGCVTLKIDVQDSRTWRRPWQLTLQVRLEGVTSAYYQRQERMLNSFLPKRLWGAPTNSHSILSLCRLGWTNRRLNWYTLCHLSSSLARESLSRVRKTTILKDLTRKSHG